MFVIMGVSSSACRYPQGFVHGHERDDAAENAHAEEEVAVGLEHDELDVGGFVFTQEDFGEEMEERVAQQATDSEGDHNGEGGRIDVRRTQCEEKVGWT